MTTFSGLRSPSASKKMRWRPARMRRHARGVSPTFWPSTYTAAKGTALTLRHPEPPPDAVGSGALVLGRGPTVSAAGEAVATPEAATPGARRMGAGGRALESGVA